MKQITILMAGFVLLLIAEFSSAKYLLVDIGDDVDDGFGTINGNGLDLSDNAKSPKVEPDNCTVNGAICMPMEKPCCKGLSCEADPLQYVYRCEEKKVVHPEPVKCPLCCIANIMCRAGEAELCKDPSICPELNPNDNEEDRWIAKEGEQCGCTRHEGPGGTFRCDLRRYPKCQEGLKCNYEEATPICVSALVEPDNCTVKGKMCGRKPCCEGLSCKPHPDGLKINICVPTSSEVTYIDVSKLKKCPACCIYDIECLEGEEEICKDSTICPECKDPTICPKLITNDTDTCIPKEMREQSLCRDYSDMRYMDEDGLPDCQHAADLFTNGNFQEWPTGDDHWPKRCFAKWTDEFQGWTAIWNPSEYEKRRKGAHAICCEKTESNSTEVDSNSTEVDSISTEVVGVLPDSNARDVVDVLPDIAKKCKKNSDCPRRMKCVRGLCTRVRRCKKEGQKCRRISFIRCCKGLMCKGRKCVRKDKSLSTNECKCGKCCKGPDGEATDDLCPNGYECSKNPKFICYGSCLKVDSNAKSELAEPNLRITSPTRQCSREVPTPSPWDTCNTCGCSIDGCIGSPCTKMGCQGPVKSKLLGDSCSISMDNCVDGLVCEKLVERCNNDVGICNKKKVEGMIGMPAPGHLSVVGWKLCLGMMTVGTAEFVCFPAMKPEKCAMSAWKQLWSLKDRPDRCNDHERNTGMPAPKPRPTMKPKPSPKQRGISEVCELPMAPGRCLAAKPRVYFDSSDGQCKDFIYGGCEGNANNFRNKEECEELCGGGGMMAELEQSLL